MKVVALRQAADRRQNQANLPNSSSHRPSCCLELLMIGKIGKMPADRSWANTIGAAYCRLSAACKVEARASKRPATTTLRLAVPAQ